MTPLFSTVRFPNSRLFRFCFPSLEPITVVKAIIAVLDEQHSQAIYLPFFANFTSLLRLLPSFLRDFAQWVILTSLVPSFTNILCSLRMQITLWKTSQKFQAAEQMKAPSLTYLIVPKAIRVHRATVCEMFYGAFAREWLRFGILRAG